MQGKQEMISRFRDSSVMKSRDETFRPLVFCSSGHNKGAQEPFPLPSSVATDEANRKLQRSPSALHGEVISRPPDAQSGPRRSRSRHQHNKQRVNGDGGEL